MNGFCLASKRCRGFFVEVLVGGWEGRWRGDSNDCKE
jgi:hypothetical protein